MSKIIGALLLVALAVRLVVLFFFKRNIRSVYKGLHADHETGAADNKTG